MKQLQYAEWNFFPHRLEIHPFRCHIAVIEFRSDIAYHRPIWNTKKDMHSHWKHCDYYLQKKEVTVTDARRRNEWMNERETTATEKASAASSTHIHTHTLWCDRRRGLQIATNSWIISKVCKCGEHSPNPIKYTSYKCATGAYGSDWRPDWTDGGGMISNRAACFCLAAVHVRFWSLFRARCLCSYVWMCSTGAVWM